MITPKHFLMGLGLHNMTGQNNVIDIVSKLGHSISYYRTCEIEFAQAEISSIWDPITFTTRNTWWHCINIFWVDNLDKKIDSKTGGGMIHVATLVAFREKSLRVVKTVRKVANIPKSRHLSFINHTSLPWRIISIQKMNHLDFIV